MGVTRYMQPHIKEYVPSWHAVTCVYLFFVFLCQIIGPNTPCYMIITSVSTVPKCCNHSLAVSADLVSVAKLLMARLQAYKVHASFCDHMAN